MRDGQAGWPIRRGRKRGRFWKPLRQCRRVGAVARGCRAGAVRNLRIVGGAKGGAGGDRALRALRGLGAPLLSPVSGVGGPCRPLALPSVPQAPQV